jgi:phage-related protein
VLPNATKFRDDLRLMIKRVEGSMALNLKVEADTRPAERAVDKLRDDIKKRAADLKVDAKTLKASADIARAARDRRVTIAVDVSKASLVKVASVLAALSGARLVGDTFKNIGESLANIDRNLPKIALMATTIASLGSGALSALAGLITLGGGIAQVAGLGLALPGIFGGVIASFAVLFVALRNAPTVLEPLKQSFLDLGATINDSFWARAADPIMSFVNGILPQLRDGLSGVSNSLGAFTQRLADSFAASFGSDRLAVMFNSLAQAIDIASTGTDAFANTITTLGIFGAAYLPRLAQFFTDIGNQFNAFLTQAAGDGRLNLWVENGITALGLLASSIGSIAQIFAGINDAAMAAGGGGLAQFAAVLATVAGIINGPVFQSALTTILAGANAGFSALAGALGPIGDAISTLAPTIAGVLTTAGQALGGFLTAIAGALETPAFQEGLTAFFDGIKSGMDAIGPALPAVAGALGTLGKVVGQLAATVGPVLAAALTAIAPLFTDLLTQISPLIPILGDALIESIEALAPALLSLAQEVFPPLVAAVISLAPLLPSLVTFFAQLLAATGPMAASLLESLLPAFTTLVPALITMIDSLTPLLQYLPLLATNIQILAAIISSVLVVAFSILQLAWTTFTALITGDWSKFASTITGITNNLGSNLGGIWQGVVDSVTRIVTSLGPKLLSAVGNAWNGVVGFFSGAGSWLVDAGASIIQGLVNGINSRIGAARAAAENAMSAIRNFFPFSPAKEGPFSGRGWTLYSGRALMDGYAEGIESKKARLRSAVSSTLGSAALSGTGSVQLRGQTAVAGAGFPGEVTLLDADGSILTKAKVIAKNTVDENDDDTRVGLENGKRR